jgi:SGNH hydrolase-like domain, acetyltransferase AlgX
VNRSRALAVVVAALAAAALPAASVSASSPTSPPAPTAERSVHTALDMRRVDAATVVSGRAATDSTGTITGFDGLEYSSAPFVVPGLQGELYLGPDFDTNCVFGPRYIRPLKTFAKVARLIASSGRTVIFTAAPNKSSVITHDVDQSTLPHGDCDARGEAAQSRILRTFDDPNYLPLVDALKNSRHQAYWLTDPHWSSVGGSVFAKQVARRLDPRLGRLQKYTYGTEVGLGMLNAAQGINTTETLETAFPRTSVKVRTGRGCADWAGYPTLIYEHCWVSSPARKTWPGHTLLLGDSFMMYALQSMRPIFRHGTFMWLGHTDHDVAVAVKHSDTVVIEVVQLFVPGTVIATRSFRKELRRTLF